MIFPGLLITINIFSCRNREEMVGTRFRVASNSECSGGWTRSRTLNKTRNRELAAYRVPQRFFRRNLCPIMNLHSVDSVRSGVNAGACVVRERGPAWDSWPIGPTRVHGLARFSAESEVLTPISSSSRRLIRINKNCQARSLYDLQVIFEVNMFSNNRNASNAK